MEGKGIFTWSDGRYKYKLIT